GPGPARGRGRHAVKRVERRVDRLPDRGAFVQPQTTERITDLLMILRGRDDLPGVTVERDEAEPEPARPPLYERRPCCLPRVDSRRLHIRGPPPPPGVAP